MSEQPVGPRWQWVVLLAGAVLLLSGLGQIDASAPDEPRYLQVAEELRSMRHGPEGLVLLHLNDEVYTQKPPLYYWMAAAFGAPFGKVTETSARLPSALAGLLCLWLTMRLGNRLFGSPVGILGAVLLLSVFEFGHLARRVQLDVMLAAFELLALVGFWWLDRGLKSRTLALFTLHGAMSLAILTKGPVGFLIPALTIVAYLGWEGRLRQLPAAFPWWGLVLSIVPGVAWISAATALAPAGYADDAVTTNLIGRFFQGTSHERPFYYFFYQFPLDFLPWTLLWPIVWIVGRNQVFGKAEAAPETRRAWRFLLAGVAVSFVFFSISSGKRGLYMVPVFPAMALLCADATLRFLAGRAALPRGFAIGGAVIAALVALVGTVAMLAGLGWMPALPENIADALGDAQAPYLVAFASACLGILSGVVVAWVLLARNRARLLPRLAVPVVAILAFELSIFTLLYRALDPVTSTRAVAEAAARITEPEERVGLLGDRAMVGGLRYYGDRRIAALKTQESVEDFFAEGGRAIVLKRRKLDRITVVSPVEIVHSSRSGRRELVVVVPRDVAAGPREGATEGATEGAAR